MSSNPRLPPTTALCPKGAGAGVTENTGFVRTSHSSLTGQEMVPRSSADLMSAVQGLHAGMGSKRGEPSRIPGQGSTQTARRSPGVSPPPPVSLHRQVHVNQSSSPQPLLPAVLFLPISFPTVPFLHKLLFRNFRAGPQGTQERQRNKCQQPSNKVLL